MRQSKHQWYLVSTDQKTSDITIDMKRRDEKHFQNLTAVKKKQLKEYIDRSKRMFDAFITELEEFTK